MDRAAARALAKTTLDSLGVFAKGFLSEPESFGGYNPIFVVHSKSLTFAPDTRDDTIRTTELWVTIYVRRERDASDTDKDAIEATLDSLTLDAMEALWNAFADVVPRGLTIGPSETGYPQRDFDSASYRLERFPIRFDDDVDT